jgi:hypothetical protein
VVTVSRNVTRQTQARFGPGDCLRESAYRSETRRG